VLNVLPFLISEGLTMTRDTSVRDTDTIQEETEGKRALQRLTMTRETQYRRRALQRLTMTRDTSVRDTGTIQEETKGKTGLQRVTMTRETSVRDTDTIQEETEVGVGEESHSNGDHDPEQ
jgi:hypothetical protein